MQTLEQCITVLLEAPELPGETSNIDMETRIQLLFENLNSSAIRFQQLYYDEREHIVHLDQQRCGGYMSAKV